MSHKPEPISVNVNEYGLADVWFHSHTASLINNKRYLHLLKGDISVGDDFSFKKLKEAFKELDIEVVCSEYGKGTKDTYQVLGQTSGQTADCLIACDFYSSLLVFIYSNSSDAAEKLYKSLDQKIKGEPSSPNSIPFSFWQQDEDGGCESRCSNRTCPTLEEIRTNYQPKVFEEVSRIASLEEPYQAGKIVLWHGPPGNGKTFLIRALARYWHEKFKLVPEVIVDAEKLYENPKYLTSLLLSRPRDAEDSPFRLFIAEDSAQLFADGCRNSSGFSRLLNTVDGLLGQGEKILFLFTANETISEIDKAILRPGRCLQNLEVPNWNRARAEDWLRSKDQAAFITKLKGEQSLADLYALINNVTIASTGKGTFGFQK